MLKLWSVFLGLVLAVAVVGEIGGITPILAAVAEKEPTLPSEILNLPELPVLRDLSDRTAAPTVGDEVRMIGTSNAVPTLSADQMFKVEDPLGEEHLSNQGWVIVQSDGKFKQTQGASELEFAFLVSPIKGGKVFLPTLVLRDVNGKALVRTRPLEIEIGSAISPDDPNPNEMVPARPPISLPFPWWVALLISLVVLCTVGLALYWIVRYVRKRKALTYAETVLPIHAEDEVAMEALKLLEAKNYPREKKFKNHYFSVSEILKSYLGKRYGFDASESTAKEIINFFEDSKLVSDQVVDRIETLFEKLDPVKFSDHVPNLEETLWVIQEARGIIQFTRRMPVPESLLPASLNASSTSEVPRAP
ncbi:MAG: hypothetical protein AABZ55_04890 [Bdellovibrionota bacterium]